MELLSIVPAWLRCDIMSGLKPKPAKPKSCEFDYGGTLTLSAKGRTGLTCRNRRGHGFFLSRERWARF